MKSKITDSDAICRFSDEGKGLFPKAKHDGSKMTDERIINANYYGK